MRLLFVADGHSPIACNWIAHFVEAGHEVHLASTFPAAPDLALASATRIPLTFSGLATARGEVDEGSVAEPARVGTFVRGARGLGLRGFLRHWLGPLTIPPAARRLRRLIDQVRPDLVHALRIPLEGMLAAASRPTAPLLLSVWGNDFTLHAAASPLMARGTRLALRRAAGLHVDCRRDLRLAGEGGYPAGRAPSVGPGTGGAGAAGRRAERWARRRGLEAAAHPLPPLSPLDMAAAFRRALVAVSPS